MLILLFFSSILNISTWLYKFDFRIQFKSNTEALWVADFELHQIINDKLCFDRKLWNYNINLKLGCDVSGAHLLFMVYYVHVYRKFITSFHLNKSWEGYSVALFIILNRNNQSFIWVNGAALVLVNPGNDRVL